MQSPPPLAAPHTSASLPALSHTAMALQHQHLHSPPPYHPHNFNDLKLPAVPAASFLTNSPPQLPTLEPLPSMMSLTNALDAPHISHPKSTHAHHRAHLKTLQLPRIHDMIPPDMPSPTDAGSVASFDTFPRRRDTSVSMQDADDRMAAEALCGLGKVESNHSHNSLTTLHSYESLGQYRLQDDESRRHRGSNEEPEPFLQLLTSSHPWLGGTINNSLSAYSSTKSHSPRIIQYGADFVERNIGSPVVSTVGSVGRRTGVEGSIRRYLDARRPSELERIDPEILGQDPSAKRRRIESGEDSRMDVDSDHDGSARRKISEQSSVDTLPAYDDNRSPEYEENSMIETPRPHQRQFRPAANRSWSTQLMISTSGLGAALNEASLRSLKYCLHILRTANRHVRNLMEMLKRLLSDYERAPHSPRRLENGANHKPPGESAPGAVHIEDSAALDHDPADDRSAEDHPSAETIARHIQRLNDEIWQTLKNVVTSVSRYTGGALPESAAGLVKWQLMSVPSRWQRAVSNSASTDSGPAASQQTQKQQPPANVAGGPPQHVQPGAGRDATDAVGSAHRMLAFAIEGIDMMEQVGGVVDSTIVSAEAWLDRMGRQPREPERLEAEGGATPEGQDGVGAGPGMSPPGREREREGDAVMYDGLQAPQPQHPPVVGHFR